MMRDHRRDETIATMMGGMISLGDEAISIVSTISTILMALTSWA